MIKRRRTATIAGLLNPANTLIVTEFIFRAWYRYTRAGLVARSLPAVPRQSQCEVSQLLKAELIKRRGQWKQNLEKCLL